MATPGKPFRYSNTNDLDRYYKSVFKKLSDSARHALLIQPKEPEFLDEGFKHNAIKIFSRLSKKTQDALLAQLKRHKDFKNISKDKEVVNITKVIEYYSKLSESTQATFLTQLERVENTEKQTKQKTITKADEITVLIKRLRKEPVAYFRLRIQWAKRLLEESQYGDLEVMLSTREAELEYEKGGLGWLFLFR